ncbi:PREDICTED: stress-response A/B barrel domain-containing protein DABB1-like [Camelina sativa]|uniref:Stress-response A/B barrel domain-containing protein DABB1-like n=1 Tax=Camelina sativa TaxID=90675 RepID=A0ABM1QX20_CAMSA|nr:PREDICTED: stress-response A/B barrel domain-containing protein DABB1-like [Camelina sativa]
MSSSIVEHVVLFKLKNNDDVDSNKISSMVNGINELINLDQVLHLSCGSIHRLSSTTAASAAFTHVLHSRYRSKEDLDAYAIHPDHVRVVKESESIREDVLAVDWIAEKVPGILAPPPGSIGKITVVKVKETVTEEVKSEIMEVIKEKSKGVDQMIFVLEKTSLRVELKDRFRKLLSVSQSDRFRKLLSVFEFVVPPKLASV